jgi:hypothetical protein
VRENIAPFNTTRRRKPLTIGLVIWLEMFTLANQRTLVVAELDVMIMWWREELLKLE